MFNLQIIYSTSLSVTVFKYTTTHYRQIKRIHVQRDNFNLLYLVIFNFDAYIC